MKEFLKKHQELVATLAAPLIGLVILLGVIIYQSRPYKPQHKAGEVFEYWYSGNEFKKPTLAKLGQIMKVGKENYLIEYYWCNLVKMGMEQTDTEDIKTFDTYYKIVTSDELINDMKGCIKK